MQGQTHADAARTTLQNQCAEDPRREPHEKETTITLDGDRDRPVVTSFKKSVFSKLLERPNFEVKRLTVLTDEGQYRTIDSLDKVAANPSMTIIGVAGWLPVGALTIGDARRNNSHANIVK